MATTGVILLAEDDRRLRKLYTDAFEASGYSILSVSDGDEALEMLHRVQPKVILLDIMMPRLSGIETCKRARKMLGSEVPIIFLTALDELDTLQDCIAAGGDDYLIKSESVTTVIERVGRWVQQPRPTTQNASPTTTPQLSVAETAGRVESHTRKTAKTPRFRRLYRVALFTGKLIYVILLHCGLDAKGILERMSSAGREFHLEHCRYFFPLVVRGKGSALLYRNKNFPSNKSERGVFFHQCYAR